MTDERATLKVEQPERIKYRDNFFNLNIVAVGVVAAIDVLLAQRGRPKMALRHLHATIDIDRQHQQQDPAPLILDLTTSSTLLDMTGDNQDSETLRAELARLTELHDHD
jgi:hypothetical protein